MKNKSRLFNLNIGFPLVLIRKMDIIRNKEVRTRAEFIRTAVIEYLKKYEPKNL